MEALLLVVVAGLIMVAGLIGFWVFPRRMAKSRIGFAIQIGSWIALAAAALSENRSWPLIAALVLGLYVFDRMLTTHADVRAMSRIGVGAATEAFMGALMASGAINRESMVNLREELMGAAQILKGKPGAEVDAEFALAAELIESFAITAENCIASDVGAEMPDTELERRARVDARLDAITALLAQAFIEIGAMQLAASGGRCDIGHMADIARSNLKRLQLDRGADEHADGSSFVEDEYRRAAEETIETIELKLARVADRYKRD